MGFHLGIGYYVVIAIILTGPTDTAHTSESIMQLNDKSGIKCDLCGTDHKAKFTYYSIDIKHVNMVNNYASRSDMSGAPIFSFDVCEGCFTGWAELIKKHYKAADKGLFCDLSGTQIPANGAFYYGDVTKVSVNISNKQSAVNTDSKHVELCISETVYNGLKDKLIQIRQASTPTLPSTPQAQQWSSTAE